MLLGSVPLPHPTHLPSSPLLSCRVFYSMFFEASQCSLSKNAIRRNRTVINPKPPTPLTPRRLSSTPNTPSRKFGGLKLRKGNSFDVSSDRLSLRERHITETVSCYVCVCVCVCVRACVRACVCVYMLQYDYTLIAFRWYKGE